MVWYAILWYIMVYYGMVYYGIIMVYYRVILYISPNSVHTEGVLAVILGLADWSDARTDVFCDQLLCAGCGDRPCCLAPV